MLEYYDEIDFADWTHAITGARMLKAQHPEFEMFSQGVHHAAGVACADCHMPYERQGSMKVSNHHVKSPLLNVGNACQTCHSIPEEEILERAHNIQDRHYRVRHIAMDALVELIRDIEEAMENGTQESKLNQARRYHRQASFLVDFVEAENSMGFHAPQESARVLAEAIDLVRKGQEALR